MPVKEHMCKSRGVSFFFCLLKLNIICFVRKSNSLGDVLPVYVDAWDARTFSVTRLGMLLPLRLKS